MATTDPKRIGAIASALRNACSAISGDQDMLNEAADTRKRVAGDANSMGTVNVTRLSVARDLAKQSSRDQWTPAELKAAITHARKMSNVSGDPDADARTDKTIGVFISEMRRVAHPNVRDVFGTIADACQSAWDAENELLATLESKKDWIAPVHKYKPRIWHLTIDLARRVCDGETTIFGPYDVIEWCAAHDPDEDAYKISKKIEVMVETLAEFYREFQHPGMYAATSKLAEITEDALKAVRKGRESVPITNPLPKPPQKAPQAVEPAGNVIAAENVSAPPGSLLEPATGVFDPMADFENLTGDKPVHLVTLAEAA